MEVQINHSTIIFLSFLSALAILSQRASAFSTGTNYGVTSAFIPCLSSLTVDEQKRIGRRTGKQYGSIGNSRLFADATSNVVDTADKQDDAFPTDPAKTTPEFLAGLWKLIAKGNHMVKGVSKNLIQFMMISIPHQQLCSYKSLWNSQSMEPFHLFTYHL